MEIDLHVVCEPADENVVALFTLSRDDILICGELPLDQAVSCFRDELESLAC